MRHLSEQTAKHTAKQLQSDDPNGELASYHKPDLVKLAASIGIDGRTTMTKSQLIDAIRDAARNTGRSEAKQ